jgi:hypothetical protein
MSLKDHQKALALIIGGALLLQLGLHLLGFYRIEADESARSLMAWELSWQNALEPWIWPPFTKIVVGLFLKLQGDVFLGPRILVALAGIGLVLVLVALSQALFRSRATAVATAALAVLLPDRLIFGTVPLSDIYYFLALAGAALCLLHWLRTDRRAPLLLGCLLVLLAQTVRYEAMFFGVVIGAFLTWMLLVERRLALGTYLAAGLLLGGFPLFWVVNSWFWYGSLENLGITGQQYVAVYGRDYGHAFRELPLVQFLRSLAVNPLLLLGLVVMMRRAMREAPLRRWVWLLWLPLPLITAVTFATLSITQAASWRQASIWILLLIPFEAQALVAIAAWLRRFAWRRWTLPVLVACAILPMLVRDARVIDRGMFSWETGQRRAERRIGLHLRDQLRRLGAGRVLVDAQANLDYLDVLTGSTQPERFVLTADAPPLEVALHLPLQSVYRARGDEGMIRRYLTDHFSLAAGGDAGALRARDIRLILVRAPEFIAGLDASALVTRERQFPGWVLYRVRPEALHVAGQVAGGGGQGGPPPRRGQSVSSSGARPRARSSAATSSR